LKPKRFFIKSSSEVLLLSTMACNCSTTDTSEEDEDCSCYFYEKCDSLHWQYHDDDDDLSYVNFVTLQDSFNVLHQIKFQQHFMTGRLPRVTKSESESYETLHQLLIDLELLLQTWKRRTEHPFTAHLRRESNLTTKDVAEFKLEFNNDYFTTDFEWFSKKVKSSNHKPKKFNEKLTKKKFSQSTKLYFDAFESDENFTELLSLVRRARNATFNIIFTLFLDAFPQDVREKLPPELWEEVWKRTQRPFQKRFEAGTRCKELKFRLVEKDRVSSLFGAAGNLHMFVFHLLFRSPMVKHLFKSLTIRTTLSEFKIGNGKRGLNFAGISFDHLVSKFAEKVACFFDIDSIPELRTPANAAQDAESDQDGILNKIQRGTWILDEGPMLKDFFCP
jgi:hypothetical protein